MPLSAAVKVANTSSQSGQPFTDPLWIYVSRIDISNEIVYYVHVFWIQTWSFWTFCICSVNIILWYTDCLCGLLGVVGPYSSLWQSIVLVHTIYKYINVLCFRFMLLLYDSVVFYFKLYSLLVALEFTAV